MIWKKNSLRALIAEEMEYALSRASELVTDHCIIQKQSLCSKAMKMTDATRTVKSI
jgi:hypothetical protein